MNHKYTLNFIKNCQASILRMIKIEEQHYGDFLKITASLQLSYLALLSATIILRGPCFPGSF